MAAGSTTEDVAGANDAYFHQRDLLVAHRLGFIKLFRLCGNLMGSTHVMAQAVDVVRHDLVLELHITPYAIWLSVLLATSYASGGAQMAVRAMHVHPLIQALPSK